MWGGHMRVFKDWKGEISGVPWYKFKVNLHKGYFDTGYGMTALAKYLLFGIGTWFYQIDLPVLYAVYIGIAYGIFCYVLGWAWYKFGWFTAQIEVANYFNLFVRDMRKVYKPVVPK